jgi:hypothetical protein
VARPLALEFHHIRLAAAKVLDLDAEAKIL